MGLVILTAYGSIYLNVKDFEIENKLYAHNENEWQYMLIGGSLNFNALANQASQEMRIGFMTYNVC